MPRQHRGPHGAATDDGDRLLAREAAALADWVAAGPAAEIRRARERLLTLEGPGRLHQAEVDAIRSGLLGVLRGLDDVTRALHSPPGGRFEVGLVEWFVEDVERACRTAETLMERCGPAVGSAGDGQG